MCGGTLDPPPPLFDDTGLSPRVRGNLRGWATDRQVRGLSPRVRGNRSVPPLSSLSGRSIPACAGEPSTIENARRLAQVYPRVCGGTWVKYDDNGSYHGLSPRVRGNPRGVGNVVDSHKSIPACAGEPLSFSFFFYILMVYPRVCGGTEPMYRIPKRAMGLSPRVRGNRTWLAVPPVETWSIPACAGEPDESPAVSGLYQVYPRVCGGTGAIGLGVWGVGGLSPRVRGNPDKDWATPKKPGSIPACAGEPACGRRVAPGVRVYPRVCGGTPCRPWPRPLFTGLSPRVRGNPNTPVVASSKMGSIPACAGEPK